MHTGTRIVLKADDPARDLCTAKDVEIVRRQVETLFEMLKAVEMVKLDLLEIGDLGDRSVCILQGAVEFIAHADKAQLTEVG